MYVVGIAQLAGTINEEAPRLAQNLGMTAYDTRLLLAPGTPALLLVTPDKSKAIELLSNLRARGHDALAFDSQAVIPCKDMVCPRQVFLTAQGLSASRPDPEHLSFDQIFLILRATHEARIEETTDTHSRKFSAGRAVLTGGLVMSKKTSQTSSSHVYDKHEVLYLYGRSGQRPWLLRETGTRWEGLGEQLAATERANFLTVVQLLREAAPRAIYDERLVGRKIPERLSQVAIQTMGSSSSRVETNTDAAVDLLCHFVAMWHAKQ